MQRAEAHVAAPPFRSGQIGQGVRSDRSSLKAGEDPTNARPGGTRQGKRTQDCTRVGRQPRMPSNIVETREEQKILRLEELEFGEDKE